MRWSSLTWETWEVETWESSKSRVQTPVQVLWFLNNISMASLALSRPHSYSSSPSHILGEKKKSRGDNIEVIVLSGPFHKINRSQSIRIRNSSDRSRILFKVKATAPQLLAVSPKAGILEPKWVLVRPSWKSGVLTFLSFFLCSLSVRSWTLWSLHSGSGSTKPLATGRLFSSSPSSPTTSRNKASLTRSSRIRNDFRSFGAPFEPVRCKQKFIYKITLCYSLTPISFLGDVMENLTRIRFVADEAAREKLIPTPKNLHSHRVYREPSEERPHRHKLRTTDSTHYVMFFPSFTNMKVGRCLTTKRIADYVPSFRRSLPLRPGRLLSTQVAPSPPELPRQKWGLKEKRSPGSRNPRPLLKPCHRVVKTKKSDFETESSFGRKEVLTCKPSWIELSPGPVPM